MSLPVPGREVFERFPPWMILSFYVFIAAACAVCAAGLWRRLAKYRRGRADDRFDHLGRRVLRTFRAILRSETVAAGDRYAGIAHGLIIWGFLFLFLGSVTIALDHDVLGAINPAWHFWRGGFFLGFSLVMDAAGVALLAGLIMMMVRRAYFHLPKLSYARVDKPAGSYDRSHYIRGDRLFLGNLLAIGVTGFMITGMRLLADHPWFAGWSPVGLGFADAFAAIGITPALASALHTYVWWLHVFLVATFFVSIPYSKALHLFADFANLTFRDGLAAKRLPPEPEAAVHVGFVSLEDLTWKQLLDLDACTKCGRCTAACPAATCGAPLSPRDVILDLREYVDAAVGAGAPGAQAANRGAETPGATPLAGGVIPGDTLWSCTTCRACVENCPVGIEHVPLIVGMRRGLVDQGELDENLQSTLQKLARQGNSFGQSERLRGRWTKGLNFPVKDIRKEPADLLWFVGDYASYDPRAQEITRTVARIFRRGGLDFGILYDGERNSGNDVRRAGEEGLFEALAEHNIAMLGRSAFREIVTTDPHSLNALRHEYPVYGASYPSFHYTEILARLIEAGQLPLARKLGYRVTYHDPCYLGRYSRVFDAPRRVLRVLGLDVVEMARCRAGSFCCGAGGGRIWMGTSLYKGESPAENRIREAVALGAVDCLVVACPKDLVMYTDAVKTSGNEGRIVVRDVAQLVEEALA